MHWSFMDQNQDQKYQFVVIWKRCRCVKIEYFYKNTALVSNHMLATPLTEKSYEKNRKNLQTKIYLAFFLDLLYLVPKRRNAIFIRVSSKKSYCKGKARTPSKYFYQPGTQVCWYRCQVAIYWKQMSSNGINLILLSDILISSNCKR